MFLLWYNKSQNLNLSTDQIVSVLEKTVMSVQSKDRSWTIPIILLNDNRNQNLNLSSSQMMSVFEKMDMSLFDNRFITTFFLRLGKQFDLTEDHLYNVVCLFNTNIKGIDVENQEKISQIMLHNKLFEDTQKGQDLKNTIKL